MKIKTLNLTSNAVSGALSYRADQGWDITMTSGGFTVVRGDLGFFFSGSKCDAVLDVAEPVTYEFDGDPVVPIGQAKLGDRVRLQTAADDDPEPTEERMSNLPPNKGRRRGPRGPKK